MPTLIFTGGNPGIPKSNCENINYLQKTKLKNHTIGLQHCKAKVRRDTDDNANLINIKCIRIYTNTFNL